ncbi:PREDICTED: apoptosis-stimulating of p53 protein 1 [Condylura cristata]|uniref:apoptosis-stimulating of p53 protein 1 n=1 Tax=Condylura cristata TaxID=143302 RepID=UPI0006434F53|nr:PREDICTED: apoptosis-stimulating of p53 protein 1 [Condylura cristata]
MILTVFLSNNEQILTEVPITPETTCRDVVEFCKEPGEGGCHLAEVWRGNERPIPFDHMMYDHLQKWGPRREEVRFFLRHEDSPAESSDQGGRQTQEQRAQRSVASAPGEKRPENGVGSPRVELTLAELQDMAARQQQQIENQQQMLVAKVSHDSRAGEPSAEGPPGEGVAPRQAAPRPCSCPLCSDRCGRRVGLCEHRLPPLCSAWPTQGRLATPGPAPFLEDNALLPPLSPRGPGPGSQRTEPHTGSAAVCFLRSPWPAVCQLTSASKLFYFLQIRNQLNQEQNSKLQQQKELLSKRTVEVAMMDKRIGELRERLYGKRIQARPRAPGLPGHGHVAEGGHVGPEARLAAQDTFPAPGEPAKPHSLSVASSATHARSKSANDGNWPTLKQNSSSLVKVAQMAGVDWKDPAAEGPLKPGAVSSQPVPLSALGAPEKPVGPARLCARSCTLSAPPGSSQQIQQRISVPPSPPCPPAALPPFPAGDGKPELPLTVAIRPFLADKGSRPQSPRKGPQTVNSSSIYSMYLQQAAPPKSYQAAAHSASSKPVKAGRRLGGRAKPRGASCTGRPPRRALAPSGPAGGHPCSPPWAGPGFLSLPLGLARPLSPTKLTPMVHSPLRYQSDADLEALRRRLANAPRPLKKRSSITEPEGPGGPNIQKLLYQRFNTLAGGMEGAPLHPPGPPQDFAGTLADVDNGNTNANGNLGEDGPAPPTGPPPTAPAPASDANDNRLPCPEGPLRPQTPPPPAEDDNNNLAAAPTTEQVPSPGAEAPSLGQEQAPLPAAPTPPGVQEKLGVMNKGLVYALWAYEAQNSDELSFHEGDAITVLRRQDESETEWWWARLGDREGYVPKNLLGLYPRIKPRQRTLA